MISVQEAPAVVAAVHADVVLLVETIAVDRRHHELVDAVADLGVLERPVRAQSVVARRPRRAVVGRLEDADALHDRPVPGRVVGVREDRRDAEVAGRLVRGVVPRLASRLAFERGQDRPGLAAVAALEHAGHLGAGEQAAVDGGETGHLRELELGVAVVESLTRLLPRLAEVGAAPDARAVPLARGGRVDRAGVGVVDCVVDRPAFAERAAQLPVATTLVALEQEAALAGADHQDRLRHRCHLR